MNKNTTTPTQVRCKACGHVYDVSNNSSIKCPVCGCTSFSTAGDDRHYHDYLDDELRTRSQLKENVENNRLHFRRLVIGGIIAVVLSIIVFVSCIFTSARHNGKVKNGYNHIENSINNHEFADAFLQINDMKDKYADNEQVTNKLMDYKDEIVDRVLEYAQECTNNGDYDHAISILQETLSSLDNSRISTALEETKIKKIDSTLNEHLSTGDIEGAIIFMSAAKDMYSLSQETINRCLHIQTSRISQELLKTAKEKASSGDYYGAISTLEMIDSLYEDPVVAEALSDYRTIIAEKKLNDLDPNDFTSRIKLLNTEIKDHNLGTTCLGSELTEVSEKFKEETYADAEEAYNDYGYEEALQIVKNARDVLPDDKDLQELYEYYKSLKPTALVDMNCYDGNPLVLWTVKDSFGITYDDCVKTDYGAIYFDNAYKLDGKYQTLSMDLIIEDRHKPYDNDTVLKIYADGSQVYSYESEGDDKEPKHITVDIEDVDDLRISIGIRGWSYQMIPRNIVLSPKSSKNL